MKRKTSDFLSALGVQFEIWKALVEAVLSRGGTDEHLRRIITDKTLRGKLAELIVGDASSTSTFPVWKTIKLGTGLKTDKDFRQAIEKAGCRVSDWAADILGKPAFSAANEATEVDLVKVTVVELGFPNGATRHDIYRKAKELGLELCPSEVGPQLRLQYLDQPMHEWVLIGMEPMTGSGGSLKMFGVGRYDSGRWLFSYNGHPDGFWDGGDQWIFVRPRK